MCGLSQCGTIAPFKLPQKAKEENVSKSQIAAISLHLKF